MPRKVKKFKQYDKIVSLKYIPGVADKGDIGSFLYYNDDGMAVCDFLCIPIVDGRVNIDPKVIMKIQKRSMDRNRKINEISLGKDENSK